MCAKRQKDRLYKGFILSGELKTWHHYEYGLFWVKINGILYWQYMARNLHTDNYVYVTHEDELLEIMNAAYVKYNNGPMPTKPYPKCVNAKYFKHRVNILEKYDDSIKREDLDDSLVLYKKLLLLGDILTWKHYEYGLFWIKIDGVFQWQYIARNLKTSDYITVASEDEVLSIMEAAYDTFITGDLPDRPYPADVVKSKFLTHIKTLEKQYTKNTV